MEIINIKPQTVILFVGPEQCGKTFFAENVLIPELSRQNRHFMSKSLNIQYLSSDNFRREMYGVNGDRINNDQSALDFVSEQAFTMLRTKLTAVLSYPVNADFVVVDTTGMSDKFRKEVLEISYKAHYNVQLFVFDYKDRQDYFKYIPTSHDVFDARKKVSDSVKRFKDKMGELNKKDYPNQIRIKSNDYKNLTITVDGIKTYAEYFLDNTYPYLFIGDVHGCFDELKELLILNGFEFNEDNFITKVGLSKDGLPMKILFIGDIIDKGEQIPQVVRFVHYLVFENYAHMLRGNHENFVYNYIKGVKPYTDLDPEFIATFLNSVEIFNNDEPLKQMFFDLFENSKDFYSSARFIATHAPCKVEFLGKVRGQCLKNQRNFRFARRRDFATEEEFVENAEKEMAFMKEESRYNNPYHIVGHVMLQNVAQFNNKLMIDTGCVGGGKLTSVELGHSGPPRFKSVKSKRQSTGEIFPLFTGQKKFDIEELDPKDQTRIKYLCLEKVNFISGTMAPADKDLSSNTLESIQQAMKYYKDLGVKKVILQPKYMGSRGNVYLFRNVEDCYVVTRNGYMAKPATLELLRPILSSLIERIFSRVFVNKKVKMILLDAEILPWSLIGGGLIKTQFQPVAIAVKSETSLLMEHGFETVMSEFKSRGEYQQYEIDRKFDKKDALTEKYGHTRERTFRNLYEYKHLPLVEELGYADKFQSQLEIHGSDTAPDIQPFAILKVVFEDDTEFVFENESNIEMFKLISDRPYAVVDFTDEVHPALAAELGDDYFCKVYTNGKEAGNTVVGFFNYLTKVMHMEGFVAKPEKVYTPGIAPYIKVRNEDYLTIVYGHNYKFANKFNKLITKKGVKKKLQTSIKEYELGMKMLRTPYNQITPTNEVYKQLLAQMIIEVAKEKELDPRL